VEIKQVSAPKPVLFAMEWSVQAKAGLDVYFYAH
jgi:hypothetical protein